MPTRDYAEIAARLEAEDKESPELARFTEAVKRDFAEQYWIEFGLANEIREQREAKGWTQKDLAERAGLRAEKVSKIERGKQNPTVQTVAKIARALSMRLSLQPA